MKALKAPRHSIGRSAASLPALLVLGALSGSALAATEIQRPCPEGADSSDVLHAFIARDAIQSAEAQPAEARETLNPPPVADSNDETTAAEADDLATLETPESNDSTLPAFTTRVPVNDLPGFRKHMYRTDI